MASELYLVTPPADLSLESLQSFVDELNLVHIRMAQKLAALTGEDGEVVLQGDLNLNGHRIHGHSTTSSDDDIAPVHELKARAMYESNGAHRADKPIVAAEGVRLPPKRIRLNDEAITKQEMVQHVSGGYQPLNADLTTISEQSNTTYGLGFLELANAAAALTYIGASGNTVRIVKLSDVHALPSEPELTLNTVVLLHSSVGVLDLGGTADGQFTLSGGTNQVITYGIDPVAGDWVYALYVEAV
jgi:hypothetical protein